MTRKILPVALLIILAFCGLASDGLCSASAQEIYERAKEESFMFKKLAIYNEAIDMDKGLLDARRDRAFILYYQRKYEEALEDLTVCIERGLNGSEVLAMRAKVFIALKRYREAQEDLSKAIESYGQNRELLLDRAITHAKLKNYDDALKDLRLLLRENHNDRISLQAYRLMGEIFLAQGEPEVAREYLSRAGGWDVLGISLPIGMYNIKFLSIFGMLGLIVSLAALIFKVDLPAPRRPKRRG
ncbi:MAG: tetratricopeptide repeat protein [Syntrophobacterales bacterium]|nr:tetratricopeptide repeat protein [Syntrophobacterales bacterium]